MPAVIMLMVGISVVAAVLLAVGVPRNVDGEFEEGWIYGKFEGYKYQEPVCCSYYGSTEIKLEGRGWEWFHYNCEYILDDNLEEGKVYGFYYTSSEVPWAITRNWNEPSGRWLPYIEKIVDAENNVLWESHYGDLPEVCWTIIFVGIVILVGIIFIYWKVENYLEGRKNEMENDTDEEDKTS